MIDDDEILENSDDDFPITEYKSTGGPKRKRLVGLNVSSLSKIKPAKASKGKSSTPAAARSVWNCSLCTFENSGNLQSCDMCEQPRKQGSSHSNSGGRFGLGDDSVNESKRGGGGAMDRARAMIDSDSDGFEYGNYDDLPDDPPAKGASSFSNRAPAVEVRAPPDRTYDAFEEGVGYSDEDNDDFLEAIAAPRQEKRGVVSSVIHRVANPHDCSSDSDDDFLVQKRRALDDDIDSDDEDDDGAFKSMGKSRENPPPSLPEVSETFVSVKDLRKYGSCAVNFSNFMMVDHGAHDQKYQKMNEKMDKKREKERLKKEKEKTQRAADRANGKKAAAKKGKRWRPGANYQKMKKKPR